MHANPPPSSGVLAESLKRSRQTWISEGIFERYWTKVTKKKGGEVLNNPGKDTMTKLGTCTITCEPHILDAVMYAIKEPNRPAIPAATQQSMQRPIIQYGPPNGMMPPPPPPPAPIPVQKPLPQPIPQQSPNSEDVAMSNSTSLPTNNSRSSSTNGGVTNGQPSHPSPNLAPSPQAGKSTDPVIQMLAERAATDPELKALMRIVANGEASPDELKRFQTHIDDLTRLQKARQAAALVQQAPPSSDKGPPPPPSTPQINGNTKSAQSPAPVVKAPTPTPTLPPPPQPQYQPPQPQALRSKGPVPASKPDISGVVFEFTGGSGDRFLFPKFSVLEYLPGGQVIASFLIVRKGSASDSPCYDPALDYYQPMTIRLYAHQGRQLDALQKVVAPIDEVRRYMDDIMDNTTRAEYVLLAMRLPKEVKEATPAPEKEPEAVKPVTMDHQVLWATTTPVPPVPAAPMAKMGERLLTEDEKYQSFIATVS